MNTCCLSQVWWLLWVLAGGHVLSSKPNSYSLKTLLAVAISPLFHIYLSSSCTQLCMALVWSRGYYDLTNTSSAASQSHSPHWNRDSAADCTFWRLLLTARSGVLPRERRELDGGEGKRVMEICCLFLLQPKLEYVNFCRLRPSRGSCCCPAPCGHTSTDPRLVSHTIYSHAGLH